MSTSMSRCKGLAKSAQVAHQFFSFGGNRSLQERLFQTKIAAANHNQVICNGAKRNFRIANIAHQTAKNSQVNSRTNFLTQQPLPGRQSRLIRQSFRGFSTATAGEDEQSAFGDMPEIMKLEVFKCLKALEMESVSEGQESIDIKQIKAQYLKMAQMYHPDAIMNRLESEMVDEQEKEDTLVDAEGKFIQVKEAFDRLVELNVEYQGKLLIDAEAELAEQLEQEEKRAQMHELRMKMAIAKKGQKIEESKRLAIEEELIQEQHHIRQLRRQAVVDKQIQELNNLRKYEIKMLVRIDKEFSDITYVPASSLAMQIAEICKRNHQKRNPEDRLHLRPYYDHAEQIKSFDESSLSQSRHLEQNKDLLKQLQEEREQMKVQQKLQEAETRKQKEIRAQKEKLERGRMYSVDPNGLKSVVGNSSTASVSGGSSSSNSGSGGGAEGFVLAAALGAGAFLFFNKDTGTNGSSPTASKQVIYSPAKTTTQKKKAQL